MPNNTVYISIVREPTSALLSAAIYYRVFYKISRQGFRHVNIHAFLRSPKSFHIDLQYLNNRMPFDLGLKPESFTSEEEIARFIREIDHDFKVVMVMEYFDESLVLMKQYLCWETKDTETCHRAQHINHLE